MAEIDKQLGVRIKQIRKSVKLTQGKLAESVNLSVEYISRLERGVSEPSFKTLQMLAEALNVTLKDLLDFRGPVTFKDKKQEAKQKAKLIEAISTELKGMEPRELSAVYQVIKSLINKPNEKE
ncbi:MAG: helix-turn-helix transcriptional regulator [Nitrospirae bacterium]|nr:helix-turn-helix transcriptional regulator [Nitrospirota bacterium]MBI3595170.1 helix-turn-helix transcriptional regulator [Nitrospirota bacterium]